MKEKEIYPNCHKIIIPINIGGKQLADFHEIPYHRNIKLLGCPKCKLIFYNE